MKRIVILFLGLLILSGVTCTKNPTGPVVGGGPILYAVTERFPDGYCRVYLIDTAIDSLIDTILVPNASPQGLGLAYGVSPDGSRLYLNIGVIDTRSKSLINGAVNGVPTPDGKYLLVSGLNTFTVYDAQSNQVVYQNDTLGMGVAVKARPFDVKRELVYGSVYDTIYNVPTLIGVFDYRNLKFLKIIRPAEIGGYAIAVNDIVVTKDGRKLYYTSGRSGAFTGIDLVRDTVITVLGLNSISYLGVTPDDKYIYLTDPGGYTIDPLPTEKVGVYSPILERPLESIDVSAIPAPCTVGTGVVATDQIALTPEGRKAYVTVLNCGIIVIDTRINQVKAVIETPATIWSLGIQKPLRNTFYKGG